MQKISYPSANTGYLRVREDSASPLANRAGGGNVAHTHLGFALTTLRFSERCTYPT